MSVVDRTYCEHYRDGLPFCAIRRGNGSASAGTGRRRKRIADIEQEIMWLKTNKGGK